MEINSVVKRNNPVWNKETTQANFTLPNPAAAPPAPTFSTLTGSNAATYIMITNTSAAIVDIFNASVSGARGIPLAGGATFETAVDLGPPGSGTLYAITAKSNGAGGEVITVTYFNN